MSAGSSGCWISTTCSCWPSGFREEPGPAGSLRCAVSTRARRRVPGPEPRAGAPGGADRSGPRPVHRRRRRSVDLPFPRRLSGQPREVPGDFPHARTVTLGDNHRSSRPSWRPPPPSSGTTLSGSPSDCEPRCAAQPSSSGVVATAPRRRTRSRAKQPAGRGRVSLSSIAILCRTNARRASHRAALLAAGVPHLVSADMDFTTGRRSKT